MPAARRLVRLRLPRPLLLELAALAKREGKSVHELLLRAVKADVRRARVKDKP